MPLNPFIFGIVSRIQNENRGLLNPSFAAAIEYARENLRCVTKGYQRHILHFSILIFCCLKTVKSLCLLFWELKNGNSLHKLLTLLLECNFYIAVIVAQMQISGLCHHFTLQVSLFIAYHINSCYI